MTQLDIFDVSYSKHGGNDQSVAANLVAHAHKSKAREMVLNVLIYRGKRGATCREISQVLNKPMHAISGRLTELIALGKARKSTWRTRDGGRVIVAL